MTIESRKFLYGRETVDGVPELDYLKTEITEMDLDVARVITVRSHTAFRPDLLSQIAFGQFDMGWLLMDYNDILDPFEELVPGKKLNVPSQSEYFEFFNEASKISKDR